MVPRSPVSSRFVPGMAPLQRHHLPEGSAPHGAPPDPALERLVSERLARVPQGLQSHASARAAQWQCIECMADLLVGEDGHCRPEALEPLRRALAPGEPAAKLLGPTGTRHILFRLGQLQRQPGLMQRVDQLAQTRPVHPDALPLVLAQARQTDSEALTPRDLAKAALTALFDRLRQDNAPNCWQLADRIDLHESSPGDLLDDMHRMLTEGVAEAHHPDLDRVEATFDTVPIDQPAAWRVRSPAGRISMAHLMNLCPTVLRCAGLDHLSPVELARTLNDLSLRLRAQAGNLPRRERRSRENPTMGSLLEAHVMEMDRARLVGLAAVQGPTDPAPGDETLRTLAVNTLRNALAAQEQNLLLASWSGVVPNATQTELTSMSAAAVHEVLRSGSQDHHIGDFLGLFHDVYLAEVRHTLGATEKDSRPVILCLRAKGTHPRCDARNAESFRQLVLAVLERAADRLATRQHLALKPKQAAMINALRQAVLQPDFVERVTALYRPRTRSNAEVCKPWELDGVVPTAGIEVRLPGQAPRAVIPPLIDRKNPGDRARNRLEAFLALLRSVKEDRSRLPPFMQEVTRENLVVAHDGHQYRLLPLHASWASGWMDSDATPATWVTQQLELPARAKGRTRHPQSEIRRMLLKLLDGIALNEGVTPEAVVDEVLKQCQSRARATHKGEPAYRLDQSIRQLSRTLRGAQSAGGVAWSPLRNTRSRLAAAVQLLPGLGGNMVIHGDSNWTVPLLVDGTLQEEPILFGMAYDIVTQRIRRFGVAEDDASTTGLRWCEVDDV